MPTPVDYVDLIKKDDDYYSIHDTELRNTKGQANGLASLGSDGKVPSSQLPNIGGGHVIEKSDGTDMTQRANLQFVDATLTDDSTNDRTIVENVHVIDDEDELDDLPDGIYIGDFDDDTVVDATAIAYDNTTSGLAADDVQDAIDELSSEKVDVVIGKGLSTNDFDNTYKGKVDKIDTTTQSASGNPISISGLKSDQLAIDPVLTFEPIQDLHGQSKPYPAGGGKNKLPLIVDDIKTTNTDGTWSGDAYTLNGVTFTLLTDSGNNIIGIKVSGTASTSDGSSLYLARAYTVAQASIMTGCPANGSSNLYRLSISGVGSDIGSGRNLSQGETGNIFIYRGNTTVSGTLTFYPMIRLATESDATFAPYENICPISGYDKVEVSSCGKNLFDISKVLVGTASNGVWTLPATLYSPTTYDMKFKANTQYTFSGYEQQSAASKNVRLVVFYTDGTMANVFADNGTTKTAFTFTSASDKTIERLSLSFGTSSGSPTVAISELQIEKGSTATTYEPYKSATSISESFGQTVYGGSLDLRSGKFTVTHGIVDLGDLTYSYNVNGKFFTGTTVSPAAATWWSTSRMPNVVSTCYDIDTWNQIAAETHDFACSAYNDTVRISDSRYTLASDLKTALIGQKLVYELATPFTIQLTPHEISLLKTYAYVSTNGTNIQLSYHNGEMASLGDVSQLGETVNELGFSLIAFDVPIAGEIISSGYKNLYTTIDVNSYTPIALIEQNPWNEKCTFTLAYTNKAVISIHIRCTEASYTIPSNIAPLTVLCIPNKKIINPIK